jgi:excisionase family DNA binding protein
MRSLITINEAAAQVGVSRRTMERWIASGNVRYVRLGPRALRLYDADVALMRRKRKPKDSAK